MKKTKAIYVKTFKGWEIVIDTNDIGQLYVVNEKLFPYVMQKIADYCVNISENI